MVEDGSESQPRNPFDCEPVEPLLARLAEANLGNTGRDVLAEARSGDLGSLYLLGNYSETGYQGVPVDPHAGGCLKIAAYRAGYAFAAMDVAELYVEAGDTIEAVRNYGVAFGHTRVNEMLIRRAMSTSPTDDLGPQVHHYAFARTLHLIELGNSIDRETKERVFREGITSGIGQTGDLQRLYGP